MKQVQKRNIENLAKSNPKTYNEYLVKSNVKKVGIAHGWAVQW